MMVYINKILVKNFKSFGGQIKLNFQPGFNVITGPNGSGKSNIIDAVQFVLGELASKRMHVTDSSGLIFDGAGEDESHKPQLAQVTLYFNNEDRGLASDRSQVSIGRKVDRDGKSDYYLNGKRMSRKAVLDMLNLAGITPGGYNIVLQGTATRLSDLTPGERMDALQDLIGIREYDEKKAGARSRLNDAERKIEIATARIDEVKKRVTELERQRNEALRFDHLSHEEKRLVALKLTSQINQLEEKLKGFAGEKRVKEEDVAKLDEEKNQLREEREVARNRIEEYNREAAERGNTRLPNLKADLISKRALRESLNKRIREIDTRCGILKQGIRQKDSEAEKAEEELKQRKQSLENLIKTQQELAPDFEAKRKELAEYTRQISGIRQAAGEYQNNVGNLTEKVLPMQESLSGIQIEISSHKKNILVAADRIIDLEDRKNDYSNTVENLKAKLVEYAAIKVEEAKRIEEMLNGIEEQIKRQRELRATIENASTLAKEAESAIVEYTAKRELWGQVFIEDKALERIREIGEAGALAGYHGPLRSLIKVDLPNQKAIWSAGEGWMNAVVVDDIGVAADCVASLKKTKLGQTKFIPIDQLKKPEPLPKFEENGVIGPLLGLIRTDAEYISVINLIWGDTYLVKDMEAAMKVVARGYRAVTSSGDVFDNRGGIKGGYYRRPPDYSQIVPKESTINGLGKIIKVLREKLRDRMVELKQSGGNLRGFDGFMDSSKERMIRIDREAKETQERVERLERTLQQAIDNKVKLRADSDREQLIIEQLEERRVKITQHVEETKQQIAELQSQKPIDITGVERQYSLLNSAVNEQGQRLRKVESDIELQRNYIDRIITIRMTEAREQRRRMDEEITILDQVQVENQQRVVDIGHEIEAVDHDLDEISVKVAETTKVLDQYQKTLRMVNQRMEDLERRRELEDKRFNQINLEYEKVRLQSEQRSIELSQIGYEDPIDLAGVEVERIEGKLQLIRGEKNSLGNVNMLAVDQYTDYMNNYKHQSTRINELEEEKGSILKFIEEIERDKTEHFMKAFNEVCENFSAIFGRISGGGDGRLELQKPQEPFTGGVDLYLQFPGKPMRLGSGASGGERSVAAIAYLLAIQRFLKAPFYIFDEVDAHLDDVNTSRLATVLHESSTEAQFLMVSLRDVVVHKADRVYGVFAQGGRSRVLALPSKKLEAVQV
jgi:chromosome segregation protein